MEVCAPCSTDFPNKFSKIPMVIRSLVAKPSKIDVRTSPVNEKNRYSLGAVVLPKTLQWCPKIGAIDICTNFGNHVLYLLSVYLGVEQ